MVKVVRSLKGKKRIYIDVELELNELAALGRLTAQWSHLEHLIYEISVILAKNSTIELPSGVSSKSFSNRISAFRQLILRHYDEPEKSKFEKILSRIANIEQDRHKLIHGTWDWHPADPTRIVARCDRPNVEFEKSFDFERIFELGTRIGEINFELSCPDGIDSFNEERAASGFAISRLGMQLLTRKAQLPKIA